MLTVHTIADLFNLPAEQQQAVQKSIKCKDRLLAWIDARNRIPPKLRPKIEWERCPRCLNHPGYCSCYGRYGEGQYGWLHPDVRDESFIHPSSITSCNKMMWYSCSGYAHEFFWYVDPALQMIFDMGSGWHTIMQKFYGKQGAWCDPEHYHEETKIEPDDLVDGKPKWPVAAEYWIKGHADAFISDYRIEVEGIGEASVRLIHEYKTINKDGYTKLTKPKLDHRWQATTYSAVLDVPFTVYLYTCKDNSQTAEYVIPFDQKLWEKVTKKIDAVKSWVTAKTPPPWEQTSAVLNPFECRDCGYLHLCQPPSGG